MTRKLLNIYSIILLTLYLTACTSVASDLSSSTYVNPNLTVIQAEEIVTTYLERKGSDLKNYNTESISYDYVKQEWHFFYSGKKLIVGDHFSVVLKDKETNMIRIVPGL